MSSHPAAPCKVRGLSLNPSDSVVPTIVLQEPGGYLEEGGDRPRSTVLG